MSSYIFNLTRLKAVMLYVRHMNTIILKSCNFEQSKYQTLLIQPFSYHHCQMHFQNPYTFPICFGYKTLFLCLTAFVQQKVKFKKIWEYILFNSARTLMHMYIQFSHLRSYSDNAGTMTTLFRCMQGHQQFIDSPYGSRYPVGKVTGRAPYFGQYQISDKI